jgi:hypothetical protein
VTIRGPRSFELLSTVGLAVVSDEGDGSFGVTAHARSTNVAEAAKT